MKKVIVFLLLAATFVEAMAQAPKHEVRAAWVTAAYGLDWPRTRANTPTGISRQKQELIEILDRLKEAHFNTVLFQARTRGDVLYSSSIEPFNSILTGKVDGEPGYDPLAFAIEECHKRGMECHAWMVAIPLGGRRHVAALKEKSVTRRKPAITVAYKREYFLNPGHPETKEYLMSLVREVVTRYDVDGVHFDYLRYPERARNFPDRTLYRRYGEGRTVEQWRRDNLSEIVRYIYKGVKSLKPWVKVSTSPVGKYDDTARYSSRGWNALRSVYQDVQGWLAEGIQDQVYPMMYFRGNSFYPFALDWQEQSNGRQVVPGLGIYFLDSSEGDWPVEEIERQLNFSRRHGLAGQAHYRVRYLMNDVKGLYGKLATDYYPTPALPPVMPWIDSTAPTAPREVRIDPAGEGYWRLSWQPATDNETRTAPLYVVYTSDSYPVDTTDAANIVAQGIRGTEFVYAPLYPWERKRYFAVTAMDRCGNESEAAEAAIP